MQKEYRGPWQQTEFETSQQFDVRVEKELENIRNKYKNKGMERGKLYRFPLACVVTDISYSADDKKLCFSIEPNPIRLDRSESILSFLLLGKFYSAMEVTSELFLISDIPADLARSVKEKIGVERIGKKIPNDVIKKLITSDDGCPMLCTVAYIIEETTPERLQALEDRQKAIEDARQQARVDREEQERIALEQKMVAADKQQEEENRNNAIAFKKKVEASAERLLSSPVLTDKIQESIAEFNKNFQHLKKEEFETDEEYKSRDESACLQALKNSGIEEGVYQYINDNRSISGFSYSADIESLSLVIESIQGDYHNRFYGKEVPAFIYGEAYLYKDGRINISRETARKIKEKLENPQTKVVHRVKLQMKTEVVGFDELKSTIAIIDEPFFAIL